MAASSAAPGHYRPKYSAFFCVKLAHFSGRSSCAKMADTGHTGTQAPQSIHSTGSMYSISTVPCLSESFFGWMQSTGHASTHAESLVPMQGSAITYAIKPSLPYECQDDEGTLDCSSTPSPF